MTEHADMMLRLIEQGAIDAEEVLATIRASWVREDETTAANRAMVLASFAQGARDREAMREKWTTLPPDEPAPRMSSLPVTPIATLEADDEAKAVV